MSCNNRFGTHRSGRTGSGRMTRAGVFVLALVLAGPLLAGQQTDYPAQDSRIQQFGSGPAPKRLIWNKRPLPVHLSVGRERMIEFPGLVMIGAPPTLGNILRTQIVDNTVYWMAESAFESTRIQARDLNTGQTYLFDISAIENNRTYPDLVVVDGANPPLDLSGENNGSPAESSSGASGSAGGSTWNYVSLTRFASQQLYAPTRLTAEPGTLFRAPVRGKAVSLVRGGAIDAKPLASWRGGSYYITAVRLANRTGETVQLDPRDLRGEWLAATFQHGWLKPKGDDADNTAVYLVSAQPFSETLETLGGGR